MAIFKPTELDFGNQKFSVLIYGAPGVGKSTLAFSSPNAIMFDLDKGIQRVNARHRQLVAREDNYEELLSDIESEDIKNCDSIIIDTGGALITLLQDYVMRKDPVNKTKSGSISQKGFGAVKAEFVRLTNMLKTRFNKNIIYVFHSVEEKDKDGNPVQRLLCEGSAKNIVWQPIDFGCFLFKKGDKTYAGFTPTDEYFAKGCYGVNGVREIPFGEGIKNDFLTCLFGEANKSLAADSEFFKAEKENYELAMEAGRKLIEAITTPADASKVANDMKAINHCLTSLAELRQLFKDKLKELGIVWDSAAKCYKSTTEEEPTDKPEKAPKKAGKPKKGQETEETADGAEKPNSGAETASESGDAETEENADSQSEANDSNSADTAGEGGKK